MKALIFFFFFSFTSLPPQHAGLEVAARVIHSSFVFSRFYENLAISEQDRSCGHGSDRKETLESWETHNRHVRRLNNGMDMSLRQSQLMLNALRIGWNHRAGGHFIFLPAGH